MQHKAWRGALTFVALTLSVTSARPAFAQSGVPLPDARTVGVSLGRAQAADALSG